VGVEGGDAEDDGFGALGVEGGEDFADAGWGYVNAVEGDFVDLVDVFFGLFA
jgi:hypothetical protein